jgi:DNA processing protein
MRIHTARDIVMGLHELEGVGWQTILKLLGEMQSLEQLYIMKERDLLALGIGPVQARAIAGRLTPDFVEERQAVYRQHEIDFVTVVDEQYPPLLKHTAQPPWVLYTKGDIAKLRMPAVAMVGTRTPTVYGKKVAAELASALASAGFAVVSGLARGIDGEAHTAALRAHGTTIGVLGCPPDKIYPREHAGLYRDIAMHGLLVTEYPIGMQMAKGMFPMRNRIIAGLSLGVIVVEAAEKSGSLITAKHAFDESRDVFAVPGPITSPKSRGALNLLREGAAKIVLGAEDIFEEYRHLVSIPSMSPSSGDIRPVSLPEDERIIYDLLASEPATVDALLERSQFTFGHLHSVLLSLTLKKFIQALPGSAYMAR